MDAACKGNCSITQGALVQSKDLPLGLIVSVEGRSSRIAGWWNHQAVIEFINSRQRRRIPLDQIAVVFNQMGQVVMQRNQSTQEANVDATYDPVKQFLIGMVEAMAHGGFGLRDAKENCSGNESGRNVAKTGRERSGGGGDHAEGRKIRGAGLGKAARTEGGQG